MSNKEWPSYFKDRLIIDNLDSNVGIATLWMPKENVAEVLKPGSFSVCGQLYTKRGISPLLRNVLANPKIRYLVVCGLDRQGSGEALIKYFENGVVPEEHAGDVKGWKIIDDDEALLDKEITLEALELVRHHVKIIDLRKKPLEVIAEHIATLEKLPPFAEPQYFPEVLPPVVEQYPSDMSVFKIRRDYIGDSWIDILKVLHRFGHQIPGMYGNVKLVHNICVVIEKEDPDGPKFYDFLNFKKDALEKYIEGFFDKDKRDEPYTYGERLFDWDGLDQVAIMTEKLQRFPYDRGALAVLWKPHKDNFPPEKSHIQKNGQTKGWRVPCLVMVAGQCLGDSFNMTAFFRSNDMFGAWPLNAFALRTLQKQISQKIGKSLGSLTTISHVAELYEIDWDSTTKIIQENNKLDRTCMYDSRSYYIVEVVGEEIHLTFMTPDGAQEIAKFIEDGKKPKIARDMCAMAIRDMLISDLGAAADLGRQLAKAEAAVKLGLKFEQDNLLSMKLK